MGGKGNGGEEGYETKQKPPVRAGKTEQGGERGFPRGTFLGGQGREKVGKARM